MAASFPTSLGRLHDLSVTKHFAKLKDPRRVHRRLHLLQDIIVIALCAVIAGAQDWQEIETFGKKRRDWLRHFLSLPHGVPSHDTFERVFNRVQPRAFQACFRNWVQAVSSALNIKHVAIDGKTLRSSGSATRGPCTWLVPGRRRSNCRRAKSRWTQNRMKSPRFRSCWTCWTSIAPW